VRNRGTGECFHAHRGVLLLVKQFIDCGAATEMGRADASVVSQTRLGVRARARRDAWDEWPLRMRSDNKAL